MNESDVARHFRFLAQRCPFRGEDDQARPDERDQGGRRLEWARRTLENLETAAADSTLSKQLAIWLRKAFLGEIRAEARKAARDAAAELIADGSILIHRRSTGGLDHFSVASSAAGWREEFASFLHELLGEDLAAVIDAKIAAKTAKPRKPR